MKYKTKRTITFLAILGLLCVLFSACGSSSPLCGKWEMTDDPNVYFEFNSDGTCVFSDYGGAENGTYITEDAHLTMIFPSEDMSFAYEVDGETLILSYEYGSYELKRIE